MKKISFKLFEGLIFLLVLLIFPRYVQAQSYITFSRELQAIIESELFRIGPFRIDPAFMLSDVGYDGTVYYQREGDEPVTDYTATFSLPVRVNVLVRDYLILSLSETPSYVYYMEQSRERRWNNIFLPEFKLLLFRRFVLSGRYSGSNFRRRSHSEFDARVNVVRKEYSGSFFYETQRATSLGVTASSGNMVFEDYTLPGQAIPISEILNRREQIISGEFYYQIFPNSFFFLRGGYTDYKFENLASQDRNSFSYQASTGLRFPLLGRIRGTFELGYKKFFPREEGRDGFSGLFGNTSLEWRMQRFTLRGQFGRDTRFSYWTDSMYYIDNNIGGGVSFYLTRFLRIDYNLLYQEGDYPGLFSERQPDGSMTEFKRKDIYKTHTMGIVFRIFRDVGLGVNINFWDRSSNYHIVERERFFVGGYLTYDF
jgi:hypothetical protein